jgi:TP901 family phage tail tape measure protein/lambda family phage tail tape measure protein
VAAEGGYSAASQFQQIANSAASAALQVQRMAADFAAITAVSYGLANAINAFGQLEQTLRLTNSVAQGTQKELRDMDRAVRDMALGFKYSASEGASALYFLSSAGFSVRESLSAMNAVALLSQGTLNTLENTADTLASTLQSFSMGANEAMRVANLFAASISTSQASMEKLSYSMRYVGPVAHSMGATLEQTVVALSALYNAGNRGQQGGTLLRNILVRIINPTREASEIFARLGIAITEADGSVRNFVDILKEMQGLNLSPITLAQLFEQRGVAGVQTLLRAFDPEDFKKRIFGADIGGGNRVLTEYGQQVEAVALKAGKALKDIETEWDYLTAAMTNTNFASRLALDQITTLAGSFGRARNAANELFISIGEQLAPGVTTLANSITSVVRAFRGYDDATKSSIVSTSLLVLGVLALGRAIGGMLMSAAGTTGTLSVARLAENWRTVGTNMSAARTQALALAAAHHAATQAGMVMVPGAHLFGRGGQPGPQAYRVPGQPGMYPAPAPNAQNFAAARQAAGVGAAGFLSTAAAAAGVVGTAVTALLSVGAIALAVVAAWPLVSQYLEKKLPGKSAITPINFRDMTSTQVQSVESSTGTLFEKAGMYRGILEEWETKVATLNDLFNAQSPVVQDAREQLRAYFVELARGQGMSELAGEIAGAQNFNPLDFRASRGSLRGAWERLQLFADPEQLKALQQRFNNATRTQKDVVDSLATFNDAKDDVQARINAIVKTEGYGIQERLAQIRNPDLSGRTELLDAWLKMIEKEGRDSIIAARKAEAALRNDPVEQFVIEVQTAQLNAINAATAAADNIERGYRENLSKFTAAAKGAGDQERALMQAIASMVAGRDWAYEINLKDRSKDKIVSGAISTLIAGGTQEQVMAAFDLATYEIERRTGSMVPAVRREVERTARASRMQLEGIVRQYFATVAEQALAMFERQKANRGFLRQLSQTFSEYETQLFQEMFAASGETGQTAKLRVDFNNLRKRFEDQMSTVNDMVLDLLKRSGFFGAVDAGERQRLLAQANNVEAQLREIATRGFEAAARNSIATVLNTQQRILGELRSARAQALVTRSQIAGDTQLLMDMLGLPIPGKLRATSERLPIVEAAANTTRQIEEAKEEVRKLYMQLQALEELKVMKGGQLTIADIPLNMITDSAEKMHEAVRRGMEKGTENFNGAFNERLTTWNDQFRSSLDWFLEGFRRLVGKDDAMQVPAPGEKFGSSTGHMPSSATSAPKGGPQIQLPPEIERQTATLKTLNEQRQKYEASLQIAEGLEERTRVAIQSQIGVLKANISALEEREQLEQRRAATGIPELLARYENESRAIQQLGRDIQVTTDLYSGLEYAQRKMVQELGSSAVLMAQVYETGVNSIATNMTQFITGQQKDWKKAVAAILQDIAQLLVRAALMRAMLGVGNFLGFGGGAGTGSTAFLSQGSPGMGGLPFAASFHGGGIGFGAYRALPRYHSGMPSNLSPDERIAVIRRKEGVFTPEQMRAMGSPNVSISVHPAVAGESFEAHVTPSGDIALIGRIVDEKLTAFDKTLPSRMHQISRDPRRRNA